MKKILYSISDNGLGHLTRSIGIMREFHENIEFIIRNSNSNFLEKSLPNTKIISGQTDQGLILNEDGISVNNSKSRVALENWYDHFNDNLENEERIISKIQPDIIISDISPVPLAVSKKLSIPSIAISNFTWLDILSNVSQMNMITDAYENTSLCIQLPLSTPMSIFKNKRKVGYISKNPTKNRNDIRKELGIGNKEFLIFVNLSSHLDINFSYNENIRIISTGAQNNLKKTKIIDPWIEGQNLVAASDYVICKCGYGMISECLTNGIPFKTFYDDTHPEQASIVNELSSMGIHSFEKNPTEKKIELKLNDIEKQNKIENENSKIKELILEFFK